jgi:hypothetical protein
MEMSKDDILKIARDCWLVDKHDCSDDWFIRGDAYLPQIMAFAGAIAAAEREACAKVCDEMESSPALSDLEKYRTRFIADAIRARGQNGID